MTGSLDFRWYDIESDPGGWDDLVTRLGQNVFHRNAVLEAHQFGKTYRRGLLVQRADEPVGVVGGLLRPEQGGGHFEALSFPPLHDHLEPDLPRALGAWLLRQGVTHITFGSFNGGVENYQGDAMGRVRERMEFIYDLRRGEAERLREVATNHRRKLRKSERAAMSLRRIDGAQAWLMTRLKRSWGRRRGEHYSLPRALRLFLNYRRLTAKLRRDGSASLYGLYDGRGRILSMAYMLERGATSFYMIGASSHEGYECGAAVRLFWELARLYPQMGITTMNLGGVPAQAREEHHEEHGVYRFKAGFGIAPTLRHSLIIGA